MVAIDAIKLAVVATDTYLCALRIYLSLIYYETFSIELRCWVKSHPNTRIMNSNVIDTWEQLIDAEISLS